MFAAAAAVSVLLAAALAFSAIRKLSHRPDVVEAYATAGVPEGRLDLLATVLFAAVAGLLLGVIWAPVGVAAAGGLVVYFLVAASFHVRAGDTRHLPTPLAMLALAAAALALRLAAL